MNKTVGIILSGLVVFSLTACQTIDQSSVKTVESKSIAPSASKTDKPLKNVDLGTTIITGKGIPLFSSNQPLIPLRAGNATIKVIVSDASRSDRFTASVMKHAVSGTSIVLIDNTGSFSKSSSFTVPETGNYDINIDGNELSKGFNGNWEVIIQQKTSKIPNYSKILKLTSLTEKVGGEFTSSMLPKDRFGEDTNYNTLMDDLKANNDDSISFQTRGYDNANLVSQLKNGIWTAKEKNIGKTVFPNYSQLEKQYPDFKYISTKADTSKGSATIVTYGDKYYAYFDDTNTPPQEIQFSDEAKKKVSGESDFKYFYWDIKNQMFYIVVPDNDLNGSVLYRFNLKSQQFILDAKKSKLTHLQLDSTAKRIQIAINKKGEIFICSSDNKILSFDKNMNSLAEPLVVSGIYDEYTLAPTNNGVDVWTVYDARYINGESPKKPVNIGVNHLSYTLQ